MRGSVRGFGLMFGVTALLGGVSPAAAVSTSSNIPVTGNFQANIGVTGTADLHSASGTFKQWLLFTHANINVSAGAQSVGVNLTSSPNVNVNGSGVVGMTYDNFTPGTPQSLDTVNIDINGAGGGNTSGTGSGSGVGSGVSTTGCGTGVGFGLAAKTGVGRGLATGLGGCGLGCG